MATQRQRAGNRLAMRPEQRPAVDKFPARRFPIQHEIQELENELNAFNERIAELEDEGHRGHAMDVLKANAMDFARRIDELRSILVVVPTNKGRF
jgi:predicted nuclease with TOPRIM domain